MAKTNSTLRQVVAIGASAGGLAALKLMLPHLPRDQGFAYILAQHMDPNRPSLLHEILQRDCRLTVKVACDLEPIMVDCLYIIPPDQEGAVVDGLLRLTPAEYSQGPRHTVDLLFLSVAKAYATHSIGIVLSGSGSDGLQGIRAIKAAEGIAIVQDPVSADFIGMPSAIIHERLADVISAPEDIGKELVRLLEWPATLSQCADTETATFQALVRVLVRKTGVAFDQYKDTTLRRRMERRRIVTQQADLESYLRFVEASDTEADLLRQDTLISVTEFFRDAEAFEAIRDAIRALLLHKHPGDSMRVWIPGCATGEEAFSIAMVLADELGGMRRSMEVQVFATDIDEQAISVARKSVYLKSAMSGVAPEMLEKYCVATDGTYQMAASIRDMVTFAKHDLMQDPPFSRLDLVSCRNVLIYFKRPTQERLIGVFHYALNRGGYLVLGPSEGTGKLSELFDPNDSRAKVFVRRDLERQPPVLGRTNIVAPRAHALAETPISPLSQEQHMRDLVFDHYAPASVLVDWRFNVLHSHGDTRRFLHLPEGDVSINLIDMIAVPLRVELHLILQKCEREHATVRSRPIVFDSDATRPTVTLVAIPCGAPRDANKQLLVIFESHPTSDPIAEMPPDSTSAFRVLELEHDLRATRDHLQSNIEELAAANEELQSVNEEYQSTTEELQSANEELQTTNEEMQSTNEELSTVNEELRVRSEDLTVANRDLEAILNSAVSGIVVLDKDLRATRYSAASREVFDLLPTSIGKPLIAVGGAIDLTLLSNDIQRALTGSTPIERELELGEKVYLVRFIPQQEGEDRRGLLISFIDATESLTAARESRRLATVLKDSTDAITLQTREGGIVAWNRGAQAMYGYTETEALSMNIEKIIPASERQKWQTMVEQTYAGRHPESIESIRRHKDGRTIEVSIVATALSDATGKPYAIASTERDITLMREAEAQRRQAQIALEARMTTAGEMAAGLAHELNQPVTSVVHFCDVALSIAKDFDPKRRDDLVEVLTDATAQSHRAGEIIRNLRQFLGRRESVRTSVQLNTVIEEAAQFIRLDCRQQDVALQLDLSEGLPSVSVDATQIGQVLVNLAKNGIEAMARTDKAARKITIATHLDDNLARSVQVSVLDTGPGLNEEMAERLFEPFQTEKPNGLGMGLWISRSIIESHGGRLWADEGSFGGGAFHFSLPAVEEE